MAYSKQTWTDDVSAVTGARMTHIEQGIYDNSLATDKINPSGTATTTAEIEEGQITDVIGFKSLKLKGQTSQYTTTGSQLFDLSNTNVDTQYNYNNGFKLTKSTNRTREITLRTPIPSGNYYISADVINSTLSNNNQMYVTFKGANNTNVLENVRFLNNGAVTINAEVVSLYFFVANSEADTATITLDNIMLNSGSTRKNFEKYTGGKASPNPDYPQEVKNVSGYNAIEISNVNKLPYAQSGSYAVSGMTHTSNGKGIYTLNGTATANSRYDWEIEPYTIKQGDYLYLGNTATNSTVTVALLENASTQIMYTGPTQVNRIVSLNNYVGRKVTYIRTYTNAQTLTNFVLKPMICTTTSVSSFVEHQGNNFEINLGKQLIQDETFVQGSYLDNTITIRISCRNIKLKANTTYTISSTLNYSNFNISAVTSTSQFPIANDTYMIYNSGWKNANFTFTTGSDDVYMNIAVKKLPDGVLITPNDVEGIKFQIEKGANATTHAEYFTPIEICKLGTYQDYIVKKDGKWWKHKEVGKRTLNGTENWVLESNYSRFNVQNLVTDYLASEHGRALCTHYTQGDTSTEGHFGLSPSNNYLYMHYPSADVDTVAEFKEWLSSHNVSIYYVLTNSVDEEITYAPLLRQLDEVYNSGLYDVTNISQDNSSEIFILDFEACKNNINGIVEYIRR